MFHRLLNYSSMIIIPTKIQTGDCSGVAGRPETVQVLLESGADLAARDSDGCTVFDVAKNVGNEAVVQYLTRSCAIRSSL